jgi:cob(I)alamin adenosyltransferase
LKSTTRRVSETELQKLKDIQSQLKQIGIDISQVELSESITDYVINRFDDFIKEYRAKTQSSKREVLLKWINNPYDSELSTDAVKDHDVIQ